MKFLQQLEPHIEPHVVGKLEHIDETSVIRTLDQLGRYTSRDIADFVFLHFLTLYLLEKDFKEALSAKGYATHTIALGSFKRFTLSNNDLYMYLHVLFGGEIHRLKNAAASALLLKRLSPNPQEIRAALIDMANGNVFPAKENRFMLKLETALHIDVTNYRSCRRIISQWNQVETRDKKLVVTRLLLAFRSRCPKSDLLVHLEHFAKHHHYELEGVDNPELNEEVQLTELFAGKPVTLGPSDFGIGGKFTVGDRNYFVEFEDYGGDAKYEVTYGYTDAKIKFKPQGDSSTGDAIKVLSTVVATMLEFVKEYEPKIMFFSGSEDSGLASLYTKMANKVKGQFEAEGFQFDTMEKNGKAIFTFQKDSHNASE